MAEEKAELIHYWKVLGKWKILILSGLFISVITTAVVSYSITPVYEAFVTFKVEKPRERDDYINLFKVDEVEATLTNRLEKNNPPVKTNSEELNQIISIQLVEDINQQKNLIKVIIRTDDAFKAHKIANTWTQLVIEKGEELWRKRVGRLENGIKTRKANLDQKQQLISTIEKESSFITKSISILREIVGMELGSKKISDESKDWDHYGFRSESLSKEISEKELNLKNIQAELKSFQLKKPNTPPYLEGVQLVSGLTHLYLDLLKKEIDLRHSLNLLKAEKQSIERKISTMKDILLKIDMEKQEEARLSDYFLSQPPFSQNAKPYKALNEKIASLESRLQEKNLTLAKAKDQLEQDKKFYDNLIKEAESLNLFYEIPPRSPQIIDPAIKPKKPIRPKYLYNMVISGLAGLMIMILVAFFLEYVTNALSIRDLENGTRG